MRVRNLAYDAYGRADSLEREAGSHGIGGPNFIHEEEDFAGNDEVDFDNIMQECTELLYEGSSETRMQSGIVVMTLATVFGVSDTFLSALLTYLAGTLLPRNNCMPRTTYELKCMIRRVGLEHERIDTCPNGHVLYEGETNGRLTECPPAMSASPFHSWIDVNSVCCHTLLSHNTEAAASL